MYHTRPSSRENRRRREKTQNGEIRPVTEEKLISLLHQKIAEAKREAHALQRRLENAELDKQDTIEQAQYRVNLIQQQLQQLNDGPSSEMVEQLLRDKQSLIEQYNAQYLKTTKNRAKWFKHLSTYFELRHVYDRLAIEVEPYLQRNKVRAATTRIPGHATPNVVPPHFLPSHRQKGSPVNNYGVAHTVSPFPQPPHAVQPHLQPNGGRGMNFVPAISTTPGPGSPGYPPLPPSRSSSRRALSPDSDGKASEGAVSGFDDGYLSESDHKTFDGRSPRETNPSIVSRIEDSEEKSDDFSRTISEAEKIMTVGVSTVDNVLSSGSDSKLKTDGSLIRNHGGTTYRNGRNGAEPFTPKKTYASHAERLRDENAHLSRMVEKLRSMLDEERFKRKQWREAELAKALSAEPSTNAGTGDDKCALETVETVSF